MDPIADARDLIADRYPDALAATVGGSVLTPYRTATSDLDVVVLLPGPPAPFRESFRWRDWPVDAFVHDRASLSFYVEDNFQQRRPTLPRMISEGYPLRDVNGDLARLTPRLTERIGAGPGPCGRADLDRYRYALSDAIDDLVGSRDADERRIISWKVVTDTATLALAAAQAWLGTGKWLLRMLRETDPDLATRLMRSADDAQQLIEIADEVLDRVGGRLWDGYYAAGERARSGYHWEADGAGRLRSR